MAEQPSKPFDVALREKWDQLELVYRNRAGSSESDSRIGVVVPRVRSNGQSMNSFVFCLGQLFSDADVSDAELKVIEVNGGMLLFVTEGMMWAKRMVAILLSWGIEFQIDESLLGNLETMLGARQLQFGWSDYN
jgi:hypothetical protein